MSRRLIELAVCLGLVGALALFAVWRMDYLGPNAHHVRKTDSSRTAYVARNIVRGNGYSTNDMPAALIDFYDERGKLQADHWVNSDRFPFEAYAIAALYTVTGSASWQVGILLYNILCFVGFLTALYMLGRRVFGDRYTPLIAIGIALMHQYTYTFLYWKDADTLLLTVGCLWCFHRYAQAEPLSKKFVVGFGTLLAWTFLARPNLGLPLSLVFAFLAGRKAWRARSVKPVVPREGLVVLVAILWCLPFLIHSLREWGSPMFSSNSLYQLPLGTRYGMGTDTWWKYTDPAQSLSTSFMWSNAGDDLWSKFPTSWLATIKHVLGSYILEIALAVGFAIGVRDKIAGLATMWWAIGVAVFANLLLLPAFGYQGLSYRHYLGFALPMLWLTAGHAVTQLVAALRPALERLGDHLRTHRAAWLLAMVIALLLWNVGAWSEEGNALFIRTAKFATGHWVFVAAILVVALAHRWVFRAPVFPRVVGLVLVLVLGHYRPDAGIKHYNLNWFPANTKVWDVLRERKGIVASFALQGEVAWVSDRKSVSAPEWLMHVYSYELDHALPIEDVYIESADAMLFYDFKHAAPGFEQYARMQQYGATLPGFAKVFHEGAMRGYPKYKVPPRWKASTVYRKSDPAAWTALTQSPTKPIALGDVENLIYTAHGFGDYYTFENRAVVAATDITRARFADEPYHKPWEDTGITVFLDERKPTTISLDFYAPAALTYDFYWNLDLYAFDRARDRAAHRAGTLKADGPGWYRAELTIPAGLARKGLNKLGFRADAQRFLTCPAELTDAACIELRPRDPKRPGAPPDPGLRIFRATGVTAIRELGISMLAATLELQYE